MEQNTWNNWPVYSFGNRFYFIHHFSFEYLSQEKEEVQVISLFGCVFLIQKQTFLGTFGVLEKIV